MGFFLDQVKGRLRQDELKIRLYHPQHVIREKRQRLAILADQEGPLWVEGFGPAQRGAVTSQTRRLLLLRVEDNEEKEGSQ